MSTQTKQMVKDMAAMTMLLITIAGMILLKCIFDPA
jgi:hypothetical protein